MRRLVLAIVLLGLLAGLAATGFHFLADRLGQVLFAWAESRTGAGRLLFVVLIPTVGLSLVGLVLDHFPEGSRGGVREVHESLVHDGGIVPLHRVLNVILGGLVLAFGGSVGPEGPMAQMGAVLGSGLGQRFRTDSPALKTLVRAGAAAGIGAGFCAPAGGVLLTLEVFGARLNRELVAIAGAAVIAYSTRAALLGQGHLFRFSEPPQPLGWVGLLVAAPLMGLAAAPLGHMFIRMLAWARTLPPRRWPLAARVGLGGLLVGGIGVWYPQVRSAGYLVAQQALDGGLDLRLLVVLLILKMVATSITFGSGAVGGLFAPTLVMGAMFGGAFGLGARAVYPQAAPQPELFVLIGMVAMYGSIVKGFWSGLLLVAEASGSFWAVVLPGIVAGGISYLASWRLYERSVFELRRGG